MNNTSVTITNSQKCRLIIDIEIYLLLMEDLKNVGGHVSFLQIVQKHLILISKIL